MRYVKNLLLAELATVGAGVMLIFAASIVFVIITGSTYDFDAAFEVGFNVGVICGIVIRLAMILVIPIVIIRTKNGIKD